MLIYPDQKQTHNLKTKTKPNQPNETSEPLVESSVYHNQFLIGVKWGKVTLLYFLLMSHSRDNRLFLSLDTN